MPSYSAGKALDLLKGQTVVLVNNAAVDSSVTTTLQAQLKGSGTLNITNTTNQQAVGQVSPVDVAADYQPMSGCTIASDTSLQFNLAAGFIRFTFATAPTSGSLFVSF